MQYEPPHLQEGDEMSELIEKMLQEFDSGNMDAVNQILDQIDEMEGYKSTYKWRE
jgi:hypothetical protein